MITYRTFRNQDPPQIVGLWNRNVHTRGFGRLAGSDTLEYALFSKPYFDRDGLHLAFDDHRLIGLCHAGFGCDKAEEKLDFSLGALCMLLVDEPYRRRGIGSQLLTRGQAYLLKRGAKAIYAGGINPIDPFYMGIYGGSESPGILETDQSMLRFVEKQGFKQVESVQVFQRSLDFPADLQDPRLPLLRRQVEISVEPWPLPLTWWHACEMGQLITLSYEMVHRSNGDHVAHVWVWEMEPYERAWGTVVVGLTRLYVNEKYRGQGFGKLLLQTVLKHLHSQNVKLIEAQTMQSNATSISLLKSVGFHQTDVGRVYKYAP